MGHVRVWGHRGSPRRARENSLSSFALAEAGGAHGVELDLRLSRDGRLIVQHDEDLDRLGLKGTKLAEMSFSELRRRPETEGLACLEEVFLALRPATEINYEIKSHPGLGKGYIEEVVALLLDSMRRHGRQERGIVSSFDPRVIDELKRQAPRQHSGFLTKPAWAWGHRFCGRPRSFNAIHPHISQVSPGLVRRAKSEGLSVNVWTVDSPLALGWLGFLGVDGVISNRPEALVGQRSTLQIPKAKIPAGSSPSGSRIPA